MKKNLRKTKEENTRRAEKKSMKQIFFIYCIVYSTLLLWKQMYGNHGQTIVKLRVVEPPPSIQTALLARVVHHGVVGHV